MERHRPRRQDLCVSCLFVCVCVFERHSVTICSSTSSPEVNATSLSFFLVMPVQRIARYPLLLQTIQKHTDGGHPAYQLLERTAHTAIGLNCRINEYKRFREVGRSVRHVAPRASAALWRLKIIISQSADKYKKTETLSIKDKINRLNTHSIAKKTARLSQQIKHETGFASKVGPAPPVAEVRIT